MVAPIGWVYVLCDFEGQKNVSGSISRLVFGCFAAMPGYFP
jgi:hypothetical protein